METELDLPLSCVHRPPEGDGDAAVVVLHGRGADEEDLLPVADRLSGDRHVVSLRAPKPLRGGYTWYDLDVPDGDLHRSQPDAADFREALDLVADSVAALRESLGLSTVGLLGFSQGAITALSLAVESPGDYDWVVALHGYLAESHADRGDDAVAGLPVFVAGGDADRIIPAARSEAAADGMAAMGAAVEFHTYDAGHGIGPDELEDVAAFVESVSPPR
jgi:phospholipase/carboxylesterase